MTRVPCTWWDSTEGNSLETSGTYRRLHRDDGSVVQVKHFPELLHRLQTSTCISLNKHFAANDHAGGQAHYYSRTGTSNKDKSSFTGSDLFALMSQCGNNNELALQHGGFCTTWSLVAKGLLFETSKSFIITRNSHGTKTGSLRYTDRDMRGSTFSEKQLLRSLTL